MPDANTWHLQKKKKMVDLDVYLDEFARNY